MATDEHGYTQIKTRRGLRHDQKNARVGRMATVTQGCAGHRSVAY